MDHTCFKTLIKLQESLDKFKLFIIEMKCSIFKYTSSNEDKKSSFQGKVIGNQN